MSELEIVRTNYYEPEIIKTGCYGFDIAVPEYDMKGYRCKPLFCQEHQPVYGEETEQWLAIAMRESAKCFEGLHGHKPTFMDIGANTGIYSLFMSRRCDKIIAFEPHPMFFGLLEQNLAQAEIPMQLIFRYNLAVWNRTVDGLLDYSRVTDSLLATAGMRIQCQRLDSVPQVADIVKIDVEGAECEVIDGGRETLAQASDIFIEVHPKIKGAAIWGRVQRGLEAIGFTVGRITEEHYHARKLENRGDGI